MGIGDGHRVVVYDGAGLFSAARVWWLFRLFGKRDVAVLDGGLPKWKAEGRPLEDTAADPARPPLHRQPRRRPGARRHPGRGHRQARRRPDRRRPLAGPLPRRGPRAAARRAPGPHPGREERPLRDAPEPRRHHEGRGRPPRRLRGRRRRRREAGRHLLRLRGQRRDPQPRARAPRQPLPRALRRLLGGMGRLPRPEGRDADEGTRRRERRGRRHPPRDGRSAPATRGRTCRPARSRR